MHIQLSAEFSGNWGYTIEDWLINDPIAAYYRIFIKNHLAVVWLANIITITCFKKKADRKKYCQ